MVQGGNNMAHGHEENNSIFKIGINLTIACLLSGAIIAGTYAVTAPIAAKADAAMKVQAMKDLVAGAQEFKPIQGKKQWYAAMKNGKVVAYVVPAVSNGYGGEIDMLAAVTPEGKVINFKILQANETPGLGSRASEPSFHKEFAGKTAKDLVVVKVPSTKNIQALTGATITSRAVTKGIREAVEAVDAYTAGQKK
jgi:electron transport complex protein RnfG